MKRQQLKAWVVTRKDGSICGMDVTRYSAISRAGLLPMWQSHIREGYHCRQYRLVPVRKARRA